MNISHSKINDNLYSLRVATTEVGKARKVEGGFYANLYNGEFVEFPTMKGLKEFVRTEFEGWKNLEKVKLARLTYDEVRALAGLSHGGMKGRYRQMGKLHPYLEKWQLPAAILKEVMEERLNWDYSKDRAREVLSKYKNHFPEMREVDWDYYERFGGVVYK